MSLDGSVLGGGAPVHILITLQFAGVTWRVATSEVDIADGSLSYHYADGVVSATPDQSIDAYEQGGGMTLPVEMILPVDVAALHARGHTLDGAPCEVALWVEGSTWDQRHIVVAGNIIDPEYGEEGEPVSASVESVLYEDTADKVPLPATGLRVDGTTWPESVDLSPASLGIPYTTIIGRPGTVSTSVSSTGWVPAVKIQYAGLDRTQHGGGTGNWSGLIVLIAGHHVDIARVWVVNDFIPEGYRVRVRNNWDRVGNPVAWLPWWNTASSTPADEYLYDVSVVTYTWSGGSADSDGTVTYTTGHNTVNGYLDGDDLRPAYAAIYDSIDGGGGLQWRGRELRTAGDVIEWAMTNAGAPVDFGRCEAYRPYLANIKIDASIEAQTTYWEWLSSEVLTLLPVFIAESTRGKHYGVWRTDARVEDATLRLDADADPRIERMSRIRSERPTRVAGYQMDYAWDAYAGSYSARARLDVDPVTNGYTSYVIALTDNESPDTDAAIRSMESKIIYDDSSALRILAMHADNESRARETVDYRFPLSDYHYPDIGEVVVITDSRVSLSTRPGLVERVRFDDVDTVLVTIWLGGQYELDRRS